VRDWMDEHLPPWLLGLIDWPGYRLFGRCFVCGRLVILHTPWALFVCERLPLPIELTDKTHALLADDSEWAELPDTDWQIEVGPAPQAMA
jgi:hypothetical protein